MKHTPTALAVLKLYSTWKNLPKGYLGKFFYNGASGETRTLTPKAPEPKSGVSTNSTTLAKPCNRVQHPNQAAHSSAMNGLLLTLFSQFFR